MGNFTESVNPILVKHGYELIKGHGFDFYFHPLDATTPELYQPAMFGMIVLMKTPEDVELVLLRKIAASARHALIADVLLRCA
jgi:hypothetical protein